MLENLDTKLIISPLVCWNLILWHIFFPSLLRGWGHFLGILLSFHSKDQQITGNAFLPFQKISVWSIAWPSLFDLCFEHWLCMQRSMSDRLSDFLCWSTRNRKRCLMKSITQMIWEQTKVSEDVWRYKKQNTVGPTTANLNGRKMFTSTRV